MTIAAEFIEFVLSLPVGWVFERQDPRERRTWITVAKIVVLTCYLALVGLGIALLVAAFG